MSQHCCQLASNEVTSSVVSIVQKKNTTDSALTGYSVFLWIPSRIVDSPEMNATEVKFMSFKALPPELLFQDNQTQLGGIQRKKLYSTYGTKW